jgi:hypothetical protein
VLAQDGAALSAGEGRLAGDELVEERSARVHVAARVEALPEDLLRRHVRRRPDRRSRPALQLASVHAAVRHAEVAELRALGDHPIVIVHARHEDDVRRLDVAVDDPALVRVREPCAHVEHDVDGARDREPPLFGEDALERSPLEELHREPHEPAPLLAEVDARTRFG